MITMSQASKLLVSMLALGALTACGGGGGKDSPEAVAKALVEAAKAKDAAKVEALFPTVAQLDAALTCEAGKGPHAEVARNAKAWAGDLDELAGIDAVAKVETREAKVLKPGEEKDGCKAKVEVTTQRAKITFKKADGSDDGEGMEFIKLGDAGWFLMD